MVFVWCFSRLAYCSQRVSLFSSGPPFFCSIRSGISNKKFLVLMFSPICLFLPSFLATSNSRPLSTHISININLWRFVNLLFLGWGRTSAKRLPVHSLCLCLDQSRNQASECPIFSENQLFFFSLFFSTSLFIMFLIRWHLITISSCFPMTVVSTVNREIETVNRENLDYFLSEFYLPKWS